MQEPHASPIRFSEHEEYAFSSISRFVLWRERMSWVERQCSEGWMYKLPGSDEESGPWMPDQWWTDRLPHMWATVAPDRLPPGLDAAGDESLSHRIAVLHAVHRLCPAEPQWASHFVGIPFEHEVALEDLLSIYKAVHRYIRRHVLKRHTSCAQALSRSIWWDVSNDRPTTAVCPVAFAYLNWRRFWEKAKALPELMPKMPPKRAGLAVADWWHAFIATAPLPAQMEADVIAQLMRYIFAFECMGTFIGLLQFAKAMETEERFHWDAWMFLGSFHPHWLAICEGADCCSLHLWLRADTTIEDWVAKHQESKHCRYMDQIPEIKR